MAPMTREIKRVVPNLDGENLAACELKQLISLENISLLLLA